MSSPKDFPRSWYLVAHSQELRPGHPVPTQLFGKNLLLLRDGHGAPHLISRHCPHRGADLALGSVQGAAVKCQLHDRCFSLKTQGKHPGQLETVLPCIERNQSIYAWYDPAGAAPTWEPAELFTGDDYYPWLGSVGEVSAAIQDLSEGVVDMEHFSCIHGEKVEGYSIEEDGHLLRVRYTLQIDHGLVKGLRYTVRLVETGPGLTFGEAELHAPFLKDIPRTWVNVGKTPVSHTSSKVWGSVATPRHFVNRDTVMGRLFAPLLDFLMGHAYRRFAHVRFQKTFGEDVVYFKHRVWVDPLLVTGKGEGDAYVRQHAAWFGQFQT